MNGQWQGFDDDFFAAFTLPERCSTGNPLDTDPSLWDAGEYSQPSISSAAEEGLTVLGHREEWGKTQSIGSYRWRGSTNPEITYKSQPHERIENVSRLRKKSGESEADFIYRVSQCGEDDSYFAARATRAELQAESAFDHGWLVEEEGEEV